MIPRWPLIGKLLRSPMRILELLVVRHRSFRFLRETAQTSLPITFDMWFRHFVLRGNTGPYWPIHPTSEVKGWKNILVGVETCPGYMPGCYIQGLGKIKIGSYGRIAANVSIISSNHDVEDLSRHALDEVTIGDYCWLSAGAVVLPGVTLGDFTIVGAGAVVTKSFPDGFCVIAGNPAKMIRRLDPARCVRHESPYRYHGYIRDDEFDRYRRDHLHV
ncbi:carbonic anhydrase/acetyltransferase-like protein (isoleucine patch superfamily) [Rhodoligotrophos appendicifer]|uniref:acyltransferase n=1 Tax=Rhodoligotrophos appendicifer TaxID=987056 RepID=UPI00117E0BF7|nr:acyltransferase [Rhodoligotrophos appendicifer]